MTLHEGCCKLSSIDVCMHAVNVSSHLDHFVCFDNDRMSLWIYIMLLIISMSLILVTVSPSLDSSLPSAQFTAAR